MPLPSAAQSSVDQPVRHRITVRGTVQGVGFRPFVYRCARAAALGGWVMNSPDGLVVEAEGPPSAVRTLLESIRESAPANAVVEAIAVVAVPTRLERSFEIRESSAGARISTSVLPDLATCDDCLAEVFDPADRRHLYPFTTCTYCGPRFSVIESLPYERARTSMKDFALCSACAAEYGDPNDRRFHAESNACPDCGPQLSLMGVGGRALAEKHEALEGAAEAIGRGLIVAVKGLGGFHLVVDARNEHAVRRLRRRKHRATKPFATLFPSLESIAECCRVEPTEADLLTSPAAPIVLLERRSRAGPAGFGQTPLAEAVAPANPYLGVMLPYTPLHHILMRALAFPVVATSANVSDEPILFDERIALGRLAGIADLFLVHDRPILRPADDSIARVLAGETTVLRRARGFAPAPVASGRGGAPILAVGGQLKSTFALSVGGDVVLSQHLGTLDTAASRATFTNAVEDLSRLFAAAPRIVACDLHPDYFTTRYAEQSGLLVVRVQHHLAHVLACMAEHDIGGPVLGVAWDGSGYGPDGSIWGGEFLLVADGEYRRVAHLKPFRLPGGERAVREPRRSALGILYETYGPRILERGDLAPLAEFTHAERTVLARALARGFNAPATSSVGRLFDGVSSLTGLCQRMSYEGEAAAMLEWAVGDEAGGDAYEFPLRDAGPHGETRWIVDWTPAIDRIVADTGRGATVALVSAAFHDGLVQAIVDVALRVGEPRVVLSGGCFQNAYLAEAAIGALRRRGFEPYWHRRIPPNDGGLALGQVQFAREYQRGEAKCA